MESANDSGEAAGAVFDETIVQPELEGGKLVLVYRATSGPTAMACDIDQVPQLGVVAGNKAAIITETDLQQGMRGRRWPEAGGRTRRARPALFPRVCALPQGASQEGVSDAPETSISTNSAGVTLATTSRHGVRVCKAMGRYCGRARCRRHAAVANAIAI